MFRCVHFWRCAYVVLVNLSFSVTDQTVFYGVHFVRVLVQIRVRINRIKVPVLEFRVHVHPLRVRVIWISSPRPSRKSNEYFGQNITLSWEHASELCLRRASDLPTNPSHHDRLLELLNGTGWTSVWLGTRKRNFTTSTWLDGDPAAHGLIEPNGHYRHTCTYMHARDLTLEYQNCYQQHIGFICEKHDCDKCPKGLSHYNCFTYGTSCVLVFCGIDSWFAARSACSIHGADIIMLKHKDDVLSLRRKFWNYNRSCKMYWVGLRSTDWVPAINMTDVTPCGMRSPWLPGEPKEAGGCAVYSVQDDGWRVVDCEEKHHVACLNQTTTENVIDFIITPDTTVIEGNETNIISGHTQYRTDAVCITVVAVLSTLVALETAIICVYACCIFRKRRTKKLQRDHEMVYIRTEGNIDDVQNVEVTVYGRSLPVDEQIIWEVDIRVFLLPEAKDKIAPGRPDSMDLSSYTYLGLQVLQLPTPKVSENKLQLELTLNDSGWEPGRDVSLKQTVSFSDLFKDYSFHYQSAEFLLETRMKDIQLFRADLKLHHFSDINYEKSCSESPKCASSSGLIKPADVQEKLLEESVPDHKLKNIRIRLQLSPKSL